MPHKYANTPSQCWLVSWSLTSLFSTNMAISETTSHCWTSSLSCNYYALDQVHQKRTHVVNYCRFVQDCYPSCHTTNGVKALTTTTTTTVLRPFVRDYPGESVPEETLTHPPSWSSSNLYQLLPSTMIHSILLVKFTCLAIFFCQSTERNTKHVQNLYGYLPTFIKTIHLSTSPLLVPHSLQLPLPLLTVLPADLSWLKKPKFVILQQRQSNQDDN